MNSSEQIELWRQQIQTIMAEIEDTSNKDFNEVLETLEQAIDELESLQ